VILENGVWIVSEKSATVKGKKVSLKIQKADLIDRKTVFQVGAFLFYDCNTFFFFP